MADTTRCEACGEPLAGVGPRYCARCGAPIGADVRTEASSAAAEIEVRGRRPLVLLGGSAAALLTVLVLVVTRVGDDVADPPTTPSTTTARSTTSTAVPSTRSTTSTTTTVPAGPLGGVDVDALPDDLAGVTLLAEAADRDEVPDLLAIDLGTGALTLVEPDVQLPRTSEGLVSSPLGVLAASTYGGGELLDWSFTRGAPLPEGDLWREMPIDGQGAGWYIGYEDEPALMRVDPVTFEVESVWGSPGWMAVVGTISDGALVHSDQAPGVWSVAPDGSVRRLEDRRALFGGRDWSLVYDCDDALDCVLVLVDLPTGREAVVGDAAPWASAVARSDDGRRAVLELVEMEGVRRLVVIDADAMTVAMLPERGSPGEEITVGDTDLRYLFEPGRDGVTVLDLATGEEHLVAIDVPEWTRHYCCRTLLRPPPGWEPPG